MKRGDITIGFSADQKNVLTVGELSSPFFILEAKANESKHLEAELQLARSMSLALDSLSTVIGANSVVYGATLCSSKLTFFRLTYHNGKYLLTRVSEPTHLFNQDKMICTINFIIKLCKSAEDHLLPLMEDILSSKTRKSIGKSFFTTYELEPSKLDAPELDSNSEEEYSPDEVFS